MREQGQPACVLHVRPWRETSLMLECLSRDHGRIGLLARGVRGGKGMPRRALLEPFQDLEIDFSGSGELPLLGRVEPAAGLRQLRGEALYSGLYLNELLVRLLARQDPQPGLLERYREALDGLAEGEHLSWTLRCFERDFLALLGYGLVLDREAEEGAPLDAAREYVYLPEQGPVCWTGQSGLRLHGADLLALATGRLPDQAAQRRLRQLMRELIRWHAPAGALRSWEVLSPWRGPGRA